MVPTKPLQNRGFTRPYGKPRSRAGFCGAPREAAAADYRKELPDQRLEVANGELGSALRLAKVGVLLEVDARLPRGRECGTHHLRVVHGRGRRRSAA